MFDYDFYVDDYALTIKGLVPEPSLCIKLKSLGFPQVSTGYFWTFETNLSLDLSQNGEPRLVCIKDLYAIFADSQDNVYKLIKGTNFTELLVRAPTVPELMSAIPTEIWDTGVVLQRQGEDYVFTLIKSSDRVDICSDRHLANACAKLLIYLVQEDYISFD